MTAKRPPRYELIADHLAALVAEAEPGDRLPSEAELCEKFGVSRMTARQAVQILAADGLIERRRGAGTFVRSRPVPRDLGSPLSFSENMRARGMTPSSETLRWGRVDPSDDERGALGLDGTGSVYALERLRRADGTPMAIERAVIPEALAAEIEEQVGSASLHDMFRAIGRVPTTAHAEVTARRATKRQRDLLDLTSTAIVIVERRTIFDQDDTPLERTVTCYAAERYSFQAVLVRGGGVL
ncbi:MAG: GntR family transcriptional regulator [Acidimicrobiia bacterium]